MEAPGRKRKTTKVEKMENAMKVLYEKFSTQRERAQKEAREMEARKIELEESWHSGRRKETHFLTQEGTTHT